MGKEGFDLKRYEKIIYDEINFKRAVEYKEESLKKQKIYKFIKLRDIPNCSSVNCCDYFAAKNKRNINAIKDDKLWLSKYWNLNDPFEYNKIYLSEPQNKESDYGYILMKNIFEHIKENILLTCFTQDIENNLPMWAHYANNHKGFCVQYEVDNPKLITPVIYGDFKNKINNGLMEYINLCVKKNMTPKEVEYLNEMNSLIIQCFSYKNTIWSYEKELRLFNFKYLENSDEIKGIKGKAFDLNDLGIKLTGVYLGINFLDDYRENIAQICRNKNINMYQMYIDPEDQSSCLKYKKISS